MHIIKPENVFLAHPGSLQENAILLEKAGLIPQPTCKPLLPHVKGKINAAVDMKLHPSSAPLAIGDPEHKGQFPKRLLAQSTSKASLGEGEIAVQQKDKEIEKIDMRCEQKRFELLAIKGFVQAYQNTNMWMKLAALDRGRYDVMALRSVRSQFGDGQTYILFLNIDGNPRVCYANYSLNQQLRAHVTPEFAAENEHKGYLTLYNRPIAALDITGRYWGTSKNVPLYCLKQAVSKKSNFVRLV